MAAVTTGHLILRSERVAHPSDDSFCSHRHVHGSLHLVLMIIVANRLLCAANHVKLPVKLEIQFLTIQAGLPL